MKKILTAISMIAVLATAAVAETFVFDVSAGSDGKKLSFPYNSYGPNYQATAKFTPLIKGKKPKKGDTVEIYAKGTSNIDLSYIAVDLVDTSAAANYWTLVPPAAQQDQLGAQDIKAGTPFEIHMTYTLDKDVKGALEFVMRYDDADWTGGKLGSFAKVGKAANVTFEQVVKSSDFSKVKTRKPKTIKVNVTDAIKLIEMTPAMDNGQIVWYQAIFSITELFKDDLPIKGDKITLTYKGTADIAIPELKLTLVENTAAVGWWRDLVADDFDSKFYTWAKDIEPGKVFNASVTIPINVSVEEGISIQMFYEPFEGSKGTFIKFAK